MREINAVAFQRLGFIDDELGFFLIVGGFIQADRFAGVLGGPQVLAEPVRLWAIRALAASRMLPWER